MFTKTISPNFEDNGRRRLLTGFIGALTDESNIVIHSMEYRSYSEAEIRLDLLVHELLLDAANRGLVDTLPVCAICGGDCSNDLDFLAIHRVKTNPAYNYCMSCGNDGDCPDCGLTSLRQDCLNVITMALGQTNGAASVVGELRRVKARIEAMALV